MITLGVTIDRIGGTVIAVDDTEVQYAISVQRGRATFTDQGAASTMRLNLLLGPPQDADYLRDVVGRFFQREPGQAGMTEDDPDFFAAYIMTQILGGGGFRVRRARPGEQLTTLDDVTRTLGPDALLICDATDVPIGIGGIMGGADSEIDDAVDRIIAGIRKGERQASAAREAGDLLKEIISKKGITNNIKNIDWIDVNLFPNGTMQSKNIRYGFNIFANYHR